jgi:hypothetical protein
LRLRVRATLAPPRAPPATRLRAPRCRALHCAARARFAASSAGNGNGNGNGDAAELSPWGVGFSAAGLLFPYYVGVGETLKREGILTGACAARRGASLACRLKRCARRQDADGRRLRRLAHRRRARQRALHG